MADPNPHIETRSERSQRQMEPSERTAEVIFAGSTTEALAGTGAGVLAVLGLLGVYPVYMAGIATIAVGGALMLEGGAIASRMQRLSNGHRYLAGELTVETVAGAAAVVLGILALLGVASWTLMPVAALVTAGALLIGSASTQQVESELHRREASTGERMHEAVNATQGARVLIGLGVGTLGIVALAAKATPVILTLVAMLSLGVAELLFGSAFGMRMSKLFRH